MRSLSSRPRPRGFTLVELIVVVVLLAVLASIALVGYRQVVGRSQDEATRQTLVSVAREVQALHAFHPDTPFEPADIEGAMADLGGSPSGAAPAPLAAESLNWSWVQSGPVPCSATEGVVSTYATVGRPYPTACVDTRAAATTDTIAWALDADAMHLGLALRSPTGRMVLAYVPAAGGEVQFRTYQAPGPVNGFDALLPRYGGTNTPPVIHGLVCEPTTTTVDAPVSCQVSATDAEGGPLHYLWSASPSYAGHLGSESSTFSWSNSGTGLQTVQVGVSDGPGHLDDTWVSSTVTVTVLAPPSVTITANVASTIVGASPIFTATASDPDTPLGALSYSWSFGDGSTITGAASTVTHSWATASTWPVTVTVTDGTYSVPSAPLSFLVVTPPPDPWNVVAGQLVYTAAAYQQCSNGGTLALSFFIQALNQNGPCAGHPIAFSSYASAYPVAIPNPAPANSVVRLSGLASTSSARAETPAVTVTLVPGYYCLSASNSAGEWAAAIVNPPTARVYKLTGTALGSNPTTPPTSCSQAAFSAGIRLQ